MHLTVLATGDGWIVVAKPPGLLVHRGAGRRGSAYALQIVRDQVGTRVFPVHRLDRPASGCLVFALDALRAREVQAAAATRQSRKVYTALVRGRWSHPDAFTVTRPMKDDEGRVRHAITEFRCLGSSEDPRCSLVRAEPRTGRFHQVRRHLNGLSHPVVGDTLHGEGRTNRLWRERYALGRLALHCLSVDLPLPDGSRVQATCPLFDDLYRAWSALPFWGEALARLPPLARPPLPAIEGAG